MIRPSHKSTKRKKSPQRVLGQRAGGAGGGQGGGGGARGCASACERLGDSSTGRFGDRRDAAPAHGDACRVRTVSTRSLCAFRGRTVRAGTGGTGSRPSGLGASGNHAGRCAGDPGSEGSQCQGRAVPCPTPTLHPARGAGPGPLRWAPAGIAHALAARVRGRRPASGRVARVVGATVPAQEGGSVPAQGGEQATGRDSIPCRSRAKRTLVVFRFRQMSPNRWRHSSPPRAPRGGRTAAAEASLAFSVQSLSCPKRRHLPTMPPAPAPQRSPQVSPWGRVCSRRGSLPCSPRSRPLFPALSPRPAAPRAPGGSTLFL